MATVGFDLQRIKRIINWCEPSRVLIGVQVTSHFSRNDQEMKESRRVLKKEYEGEFFELDAFSADRGRGGDREGARDDRIIVQYSDGVVGA